ncbi:MAG: hypothetical protein II842_00080 [Butyrivibrio sp.]|nr:hypothetical protein [Butyrivibrio sp.]
MSELRKELSDEVLEQAVGGKSLTKSVSKKTEFEKAWKILDMDGKGISGMKMAELYDDWELSGFEGDALTYLSTKMTAKC